MDFFFNAIPSMVDLCTDPSAVMAPWRNWVDNHFINPWILPHAIRRLKKQDKQNIIVYTAPQLPFWLAHMLRRRLLHEHWIAPRFLLTFSRLPFQKSSNPDLSDDDSAFFLNLGLGSKPRKCATSWIQRLLEHAALTNHSIQFIPLIFLWNRSPKRPSYFPGYGFLTHRHNNVISTGCPLQIAPGITGDIPSALTIRRNMIAAWNQESRVIVGDKKVSIRKTIDIIQSEPTLSHLLRTMAIQGKDTLPTLHSRVAAYVREIAADYNHRSPWIWEKLLGSYLKTNFSALDFDQDGLDRLRILLRQRQRVILVPSHRSHLDYLFISFAIYKQGLACPLVAAGINLAFWPMGCIFRKTGAFFIRRTFRGLDIYPHVFRSYLWLILQKFQPVEFFIEGGRSRTGALLPAKLGFLNMILEAFNAGKLSDVQFVPLAVNYDRIPEEDSYIRELQGIPKQKEKITSLLKSRHLFKRHYGNVCFAIGQPVSLAETLSGSGSQSEQKDRLGSTIMNHLRFTMPVTSTALVATALMALKISEEISTDQMIQQSKDILAVIRQVHPNAIVAGECNLYGENNEVIRTAIRRMIDFGNILAAGTDKLLLNPQRRLQVDYLRNSMMGLLLAPALAAFEIFAETTPTKPELYRFLVPGMHPIPVDVMIEEISRCKEMSKVWTETQKSMLISTIQPIGNLIRHLDQGIKSSTIEMRETTSASWQDFFKQVLQASGSLDYPEICTKAVESEFFRIFRQLANGSCVIAEQEHLS